MDCCSFITSISAPDPLNEGEEELEFEMDPLADPSICEETERYCMIYIKHIFSLCGKITMLIYFNFILD